MYFLKQPSVVILVIIIMLGSNCDQVSHISALLPSSMIEMWLMFRRSLRGDLERDQRGAGAQRGQPQPHLHRRQQPARTDHVAGGRQRRGGAVQWFLIFYNDFLM